MRREWDAEREIDRVVMRGRSGLELLQPLRRLRRQLLHVVAEALVEVVAPGLHHHVDRVEMSGDASVELVGMRPHAVDDAMAAFADKAHPAPRDIRACARSAATPPPRGSTPRWLTMLSKAAICSLSASCTLPAPFAAAAAASLASDGETLVDLRRLGAQRGQGLRRRRLDLRLGEGALGGDRADQAARRFVEQGLERAVLVIDRAAQLGLARIELLAPSRGRGVEDRGCVFRAIPDQRAQALARSGQPVFEDLAAHDDGVVQAVGGVVEAHDETVAMDDDGVGEPRAAALEPLDQRIRPVAEVAGDRSLGREPELVGDRVALGADRVDRLRAARADPADDVVGIRVHGAARRRGSLGELIGDRIAMGADRLDGLRRRSR